MRRAGRGRPTSTCAAGKNQFSVSATDPDTGKNAEKPVDIFITVPFPDVLGADPRRSTSRREGATFENGAHPGPGHRGQRQDA